MSWIPALAAPWENAPPAPFSPALGASPINAGASPFSPTSAGWRSRSATIAIPASAGFSFALRTPTVGPEPTRWELRTSEGTLVATYLVGSASYVEITGGTWPGGTLTLVSEPDAVAGLLLDAMTTAGLAIAVQGLDRLTSVTIELMDGGSLLLRDCPALRSVEAGGCNLGGNVQISGVPRLQQLALADNNIPAPVMDALLFFVAAGRVGKTGTRFVGLTGNSEPSATGIEYAGLLAGEGWAVEVPGWPPEEPDGE